MEESVASNAWARQTIFDTPDRASQLVVAAELTVNDKLQDCPPKLMANAAVPDEVGVPDML